MHKRQSKDEDKSCNIFDFVYLYVHESLSNAQVNKNVNTQKAIAKFICVDSVPKTNKID